MVNSNELSLILLSFAGLANRLGLGLVEQAFEAASIPSAISIKFDPKALLEVTLPQPTGGNITLTPGILLPINATKGPPSFGAIGDIGSGPFVVMAVDANPPPPDIEQIRHFLGPNFFAENQTSDPAQVRTLVNRTAAIEEFLMPAPVPGTGTHHYIFLLFNQPEGFNNQTLVNSSTPFLNFSLSTFTASTGLGDPIAGNFMRVDAPNT